jgi:6-methylsalicylate decarboxylase
MNPFVDVHAHFLTDHYVATARAAGIEHPDGMPGWPSFDLGEQIAVMDRRGIERAVLSISSPGVHFGDDAAAVALAESVNDAAIGFVREHPDRLGFYASVALPDVDAAVKELNRAMDAGAAGIIVESNVRGRYLGDAEFEPVWRELDRRHGVLFIHPTSPTSWESTALGLPRPLLEFLFDSTRTVVDLLRAGVVTRHPGMRVIVPHSGATLGLLADRVGTLLPLLLGADDPAARDWGSQLAALWFDMAGTPFPRAIPTLASLVGTEHLLYGSDSCWTPAAGVDAQLAAIDAAAAPAGSASWRELASANAARLFTPTR